MLANEIFSFFEPESKDLKALAEVNDENNQRIHQFRFGSSCRRSQAKISMQAQEYLDTLEAELNKYKLKRWAMRIGGGPVAGGACIGGGTPLVVSLPSASGGSCTASLWLGYFGLGMGSVGLIIGCCCIGLFGALPNYSPWFNDQSPTLSGYCNRHLPKPTLEAVLAAPVGDTIGTSLTHFLIINHITLSHPSTLSILEIIESLKKYLQNHPVPVVAPAANAHLPNAVHQEHSDDAAGDSSVPLLRFYV